MRTPGPLRILTNPAGPKRFDGKACVARPSNCVLASCAMMRRPIHALVAAETLLLAISSLVMGQSKPPASQPALMPRPAAGATQPGEQPQESLAEVKLKESLATAAEVTTLPRIRAKNVAEVVRLTIRDKDLHLETSLPATEQALVDVPGLAGVTRVTVTPLGEGKAPPLNHFALHNIDYTPTNAVSINTSVVQAVPGRLDLTQDYNLLADEVHSVHLIQNLVEIVEGEPRVTLHVQLTTPPGVRLQLQADNVVELRRNYPAEVAKYLDPIFRTLSQDGLLAKVDPKLAWQVFGGEYKPSSDLVAKVQALIKQLDAENFQQREAASKSLEALGQPAALAIRRMDRAGWTEEQVGRVDAFLANFKPTNDVDAKRLRQDRDFLLDCLFADDEQIRRLAHAELEKVVGRPIAFDLSAPPAQRLDSIKRLRASIGAVPSTQEKTPRPE